MKKIVGVLIFLFIFSCNAEEESSDKPADDSGASVSFTANMQRIGGHSASLVKSYTSRLIATDEDSSSNVTLTALKLPIYAIKIAQADGSGAKKIYECEANTDAGCMVDFLTEPGNNILDGIAVDLTLEEGSYTQIQIDFCSEESLGQSSGASLIEVAGSLSFDNKTLYTKSNNKLSETGPAETAQINNGPCQSSSKLGKNIVIEGTSISEKTDQEIQDEVAVDPQPNASIVFKIFYNLDSLFFASKVVPQPDSELVTGDECVSGDPVVNETLYEFCMSTGPEIAGTLDSGTPTIERYRVSDGLTIGLYFTSEDFLFGAFGRTFFIEGSEHPLKNSNGGVPGRESMTTFTKNSDGTLFISPGERDEYDEDSFLAFKNFKRESHSGTFTLWGEEKTYTAVKLTD